MAKMKAVVKDHGNARAFERQPQQMQQEMMRIYREGKSPWVVASPS
jgi:membrane protein insertase Oxa1/YidC/SpoIIIJ